MSFDYLMDCPQYVDNSAGIRAMHYLAFLLHRAGFTCWTANPNPFSELPVLHLDKVENLVAIYPDCVGPENPRGSSRCVRFMCAPASWPRPGFYGDGLIPSEDCVFLYDDWFAGDVARHYQAHLNYPDCLIPIPCIEPDMYYPEPKNIPRTTYIGKANCPNVGVELAAKCQIITRTSHSRAEAAEILRRTETFLTMDEYTMMANEAALCGCEVLHTSNGQTKPYFTNPNHDPLQFVMRPAEDVWIAKKFDALVRAHFTPSTQTSPVALAQPPAFAVPHSQSA